MEKHGTTTIHLKVKVAPGDISARCEKELDTTIPTDAVLMLCRNCPNVFVRDAEHYVYRHVFVGDFHLRIREMVGHFAHVVADRLGRNLLPWWLVPICTGRWRACQSCHFCNHVLLSNLAAKWAVVLLPESVIHVYQFHQPVDSVDAVFYSR